MLEKEIKKSSNIPTSLIQENIQLKNKCWFQTGGPAKFYCEPSTAQEFKKALQWAKQNQQEIFVLGEGANILISDSGFNGLVIRPNLKKNEIILKEKHFSLVKAEAGQNFQNLINFCLKNNLCGLEEFSGIPGTVGGSVYINIHFFEFLLEQFLVEATVIDKNSLEILKVKKDWFNFGYNTSKLLEENHYLIDATFKLKNITDLEAAYAKGRSDEIIRYRTARYPNKNTCGSFFRNFKQDEVTLEISGKKMIYVAYYLDKIGIKGVLKKGDAQVSYQHANMIVNLGKATSNDIIEVAQEVQNLVWKNYKVWPVPECQLIGFDLNILDKPPKN